MHSILFFPPLAPLTQTEKQNCSCFTGWGDFFIYIVHTGSGKPGYTQQTENQWTTMTRLENPNTKWWGVLDNRNPAWDCEKKNKASFSPCRAFGLAAAAPTGTCFPWQCCTARPQLQTVGCPLHTHDLRDSQPASQQTENNYTHTHRGIGNIPIHPWKRPWCVFLHKSGYHTIHTERLPTRP